jgi:hypothetical protein
MRKFMALAALMCGAATADAAELERFCTIEGKPDLVIIQTEPMKFTLNGRVLREDELAIEEGTEDVFVVVQGRSFWPCEKSESGKSNSTVPPGAARADAAEPTQWCSNGFDKPAKLAIDPIDLVKLQNPQGPVDPVTLTPRAWLSTRSLRLASAPNHSTSIWE